MKRRGFLKALFISVAVTVNGISLSGQKKLELAEETPKAIATLLTVSGHDIKVGDAVYIDDNGKFRAIDKPNVFIAIAVSENQVMIVSGS